MEQREDWLICGSRDTTVDRERHYIVHRFPSSEVQRQPPRDTQRTSLTPLRQVCVSVCHVACFYVLF